jgi:YVTN family beta-propeller protein
MSSLEPGTVVAGYRIESMVGRGGMGVVYRALQLNLERIVALKVIAPELLDDEDVRRRFLAEARAAAGVDHPNVIPVHEAGDEGGLAYIAMRFVAGSDLRSLVRAGGALDPVEAAGYVAQAGAALDAIHRAGFVHRDVKPANLLVDAGGHIYVTDFGLAKQVLTSAGGTGTGQWVGTLDYVAPEQIRGGHVDARVDIYALGGVLHYALTGRVPFERAGDEAKLWAQLSAPPPVPSELRRGLRAEFDLVVGRAMAKDAEERYPSAGDLGRAARAAVSGAVPTEPERIVARGAAAPGVAPTEPGLAGEAPTRTAPPWGSDPPDTLYEGVRPLNNSNGGPEPKPMLRGLTPTWAGVGVVVVVALVVVVVLLTRGDDPPAVVATAAPTVAASATPTSVATNVQTIQDVGDRPAGIVRVGRDLFVTGRQPYVTRIDAETGEETGKHPKVGNDINALVAFGGAVWMTLGFDREVARLDPRSGKVEQRVALANRPVRLAVDESGLWVGTEIEGGDGAGQLLRYDLAGHLIQTITVPEGVGALAAADGVIWVVKDRTNKLARMKPGATSLSDWSTLPSAVASMRYAGGYLWVTLDDEDAIARIDAATGNQRTATAGHSPAQSVLADGHLFVASRNDNTVVVLDPKTLKPQGDPIEVGFNPYGLAADERAVWVTGLGDNTLTRIDYR